MPIYEYSCEDCHQVFDEWQKTYEEIERNCPVCGGHAHRIVSNTSFVLKGGGWYVTEYGNRKSDSGEKADSGSAAPAASSGESSASSSSDAKGAAPGAKAEAAAPANAAVTAAPSASTAADAA